MADFDNGLVEIEFSTQEINVDEVLAAVRRPAKESLTS